MSAFGTESKGWFGEGIAGLVGRHRGRHSNRRTPESIRTAILARVRERYADLGPRWRRSHCAAKALACQKRRCAAERVGVNLQISTPQAIGRVERLLQTLQDRRYAGMAAGLVRIGALHHSRTLAKDLVMSF